MKLVDWIIIFLALVLLAVGLLLLTGCGTVRTEYDATYFSPPGSTNVSSHVHGHLSRSALGLRSSIPQFRIGPTNASIIETSGSLTTQGDSEYIKALLKGVLESMK